MENYIWTMIMASWTPLIIHDSYELQTSMISDHSKWGFIRFTRSMITHDCYEHWLWAITVHRNSYEFGFWTINDQTHHTWWGGINAMKCWCSYMINTDSISYYDPYVKLKFAKSHHKHLVLVSNTSDLIMLKKVKPWGMIWICRQRTRSRCWSGWWRRQRRRQRWGWWSRKRLWQSFSWSSSTWSRTCLGGKRDD